MPISFQSLSKINMPSYSRHHPKEDFGLVYFLIFSIQIFYVWILDKYSIKFSKIILILKKS